MKKKIIVRNLELRVNLKKKMLSSLIVVTFGIALLNTVGINSKLNLISEDQDSIDDLSSIKTSYFNLTMNPIAINGNATGVGAHNWSWAASQNWCKNISNVFYLENLTINGNGSKSCIEIMNSRENFVIRNCTLYNSSGTSNEAGIKLVHTVFGVITENNISFNDIGITLVNNASVNTISKNIISDNTEYGILILNGTTMSISNTIFRNNFTGNVIHALDNSTYDKQTYYNSWHDINFRPGGLISPGNYWDNYSELGDSAIDADDDGIGDIPYIIPGTGVAEDLYPIWKDGYNGSTILIDDMAQDTHVTWEWASTLDWCDGSGTIADPYTIDRLVIDANNKVDGVKVQNSNKHFRIINCTVFNTSSTGIKLNNVSLGKLSDNDCSNTNFYGIYLIDCNYITISDNVLFNNSGNGLFAENANNILISNNNMTYNQNGIGIYGSNNSILENDMSHNYNGLTLSLGTNNTIRNCVANNNTVYGIQLSSSSTINTIENNTANFNQIGIFIDNSDTNDISNNTANYNIFVGISISDSISNEITGNTVLSNQYYGISLSSSSNNNTLDSNNVSLNVNGINLLESDYNAILNNTSNNNTQYGIFLESSNYNNVSGNSVINNGLWCIRQENCIAGSNHFEYNGNCTVQTYNDPEPPEPPEPIPEPPIVPGYDLIFLLGAMSVISMIILKKKRKLL